MPGAAPDKGLEEVVVAKARNGAARRKMARKRMSVMRKVCVRKYVSERLGLESVDLDVGVRCVWLGCGNLDVGV